MEKKDVWTISSLLNWTVNYFKSKNIESARLDAEVLLSHILGQERIYLYVHFDEPMEKAELSKFREYVKKRAQHMPVAYIIGEKEFMGLPFKVTPDTLIPRPDTEILVENVLANADKQEAVKIADIGTGSGAIILSLLTNLPKAQGKTVDIAAKAVEVAKENAQSLQVADRCEFFVGDLFAPFAESGDKFDIIVSNPPYIRSGDIDGLQREVKCQPRIALDGGEDGLKYYREIADVAADRLNDGGVIVLEIGFDQAADVALLLETHFKNIEVIKDLGGRDRVVTAVKK